MLSTSPPPLLSAVASLIDRGSTAHDGHLLVHLDGPTHPAVTINVKPLDGSVHPFTVLAGFCAPAGWQAVGVRARGQARHLDRPAAPAAPTAITFLVDRRGQEASLLRLDDIVTELDGPAEGTIPDLCRRVLGLPTPPPPASVQVLWSSVWLDRVLQRWCQPHRRRDLVASWAHVAALHPAVGHATELDLRRLAEPATVVALARAHSHQSSWAVLRGHPDLVPLPDGPLDAAVAAWMDDGFFARWSLGAFRPAGEVSAELARLLGSPLGDQLDGVMAALTN